MSDNKIKSFGRLAFERLISNLLSVKVWLFIIPIAISLGFLWWLISLISDTHILVLNSISDSSNVIEISRTAMVTLKEMFASWLKFTGSLVVSIIGVREIWKVNKIKEETKMEEIKKQERENNKEREMRKENK